MSRQGTPHDDFEVRPARPAQGSRAGSSALARAQNFVGIVREQGPCGIGDYLDRLSLEELYGLTTVLAALVPDDTPVSDLLAWMEERPRMAA